MKVARENDTLLYVIFLQRMMIWCSFLNRKFRGQEKVENLQSAKRKELSIQNFGSGENILQEWCKIKRFLNEGKLREFVTSRSALEKKAKRNSLGWKETIQEKNSYL